MKKHKKETTVPEWKIDTNKLIPQYEFRTAPNEAKISHIKHLINLIEKSASEKTLNNYLKNHRALLTFIIKPYHSGHHHSWVIPQKTIKTNFYTSEKGHIPDYILGGQNTSGEQWFIVELKGANTRWFVQRQNEIYFTNVINKGINQLIEYLHHSDKYQGKFRDEFHLLGFHNPKAILIAGRRNEFESNKRKQDIQSRWEKLLGNNLIIMTYDRLKDELKDRLGTIKMNNQRNKNLRLEDSIFWL